MKRTAVTLVALLLTQLLFGANARAQQPDEPGEVLAPTSSETPPALVLTGPRLLLTQPRRGARRELMAGLGLGVAGSAFVLLGGGLMAMREQNGPYSAGFSLSITGATMLYPTVLTLLYGAGHNSALRELDGAGAYALDRVELRARRLERTGIGLFAGGLGLMFVGVGMVIGGLQGANFEYGGEDHSNPSLFWSGFALAIVGDALWFSGTLVWTYGGGVHRGVREARGSLRASLGGVSGTF